MAEALKSLGTRRAWIVHGEDGLDEITLTGTTFVCALEEGGELREFSLSPADFRLKPIALEDIKGGDALTNAAALYGLLNGAPSAYRDIVLANAAAVLVIHGTAPSLAGGVTKAALAIDSGHALDILRKYTAYTEEEAAS
jgi:anthranilate phosphoribosyltransferase